MLKEFFAEFQDGIDTPQLRGHTEAESFITGELANTVYVNAGEGIQTAVNSVQTDHGEGKVILLPDGDHSVSNTVSVPADVTIRSASQGRTVTVKPTGDVDVFDLQDGSARLSNLAIDASGVAGYSSALIRADGSASGFSTENVCVERVFCQLPTDQGTAIAHAVNGNGITWFKVRDVKVAGGKYGIYSETDPANGGYVTGCTYENVELYDTQTFVHQSAGTDGDALTGNRYELRGTLTGNTDKVAHLERAGDYLALGLSELTQSPNWTLIEILDTSSNSEETVIEQDLYRSGGFDIRNFVQANPTKTRFTTSLVEEHNIGWGDWPHWLNNLSGSGNRTITGRVAEVTASGSSAAALDAGGNILFPDRRDPWLWWRAQLQSTSAIVAKLGLFETNQGTEYVLAADPTDSLGTGITGNWIFRVVESDGTTTHVDTGVALDTNTHGMAVNQYGRGTKVVALIDGTKVGEVNVGSQTESFQPRFEVTATTSTSKAVQIREELGFSYYRRPA